MRHIFIINPNAGKYDISEKKRREIEEVCSKYGIDPLIWVSEYAGYEREITEKMCFLFSGEELRFYSIGGSGTLFKIVSGIKDFSVTEVACCPCGYTNDLLKSYGKDVRSFRSIENLINGKTDMLDVVEIDNSRFVDFASFGLGNTYCNNILFFQLVALISAQLSYNVGIVYDILVNKNEEYEVTIDGKDYSGKYVLVTCLNGMCMGGTVVPDATARPYDGMMNVIFLDDLPVHKKILNIIPYSRGDIEKVGKYMRIVRGKHVTVARKDKKSIPFNCDGECVRPTDYPASIKIIPGQLKFIVPQDAKLLDPIEK